MILPRLSRQLSHLPSSVALLLLDFLRFRQHVLAPTFGEGQNVQPQRLMLWHVDAAFGHSKPNIWRKWNMPNHVTQQLIIIGAEAPKVVEYIAGRTTVDFNKVIPMPQELNIDESTDGYVGLAALTGECERYLTFPWVKKLGIRTPDEFTAYVERERPAAIELAHKYISNKQKFGHATWREWCIANWGTKWNAYSVDEPEFLSDRAILRFDTAWSPAIPIIVRLSELFPSAELTLRYFDEGWNFAGEDFFKAGRCVDGFFAPDETDARTRFIYREVYGFDFNSDSDDN